MRVTATEGVALRQLHPALGIAISIVSLAACTWWAIHQPTPSFPTSATAIALLLAAIAVYAGSLLVRGFRWSVILRRAGIRVRRSEPYTLTVVGYMGNAVLPVRGGEVLKVVLLTETSNARVWQAIGSIIPERVLDLTVLVLVFAVATLAGVIEIPAGDVGATIAAIALLAFFVAGLGYLALRARGHFERFAARIRPVARAARPLFSPLGVALGLVTVAIWTLDGLTLWLVGDSLGVPLDVPQAVALAALASLLSSIPSGPAYAGTFDGAMLLGLRGFGITGSAALSFTLLARFVLFVPVTIVGLVLVVTRYGGLARLSPRKVEAAVAEPGANATAPGGAAPTTAPDPALAAAPSHGGLSKAPDPGARAPAGREG